MKSGWEGKGREGRWPMKIQTMQPIYYCLEEKPGYINTHLHYTKKKFCFFILNIHSPLKGKKFSSYYVVPIFCSSRGINRKMLNLKKWQFTANLHGMVRMLTKRVTCIGISRIYSRWTVHGKHEKHVRYTLYRSHSPLIRAICFFQSDGVSGTTYI